MNLKYEHCHKNSSLYFKIFIFYDTSETRDINNMRKPTNHLYIISNIRVLWQNYYNIVSFRIGMAIQAMTDLWFQFGYLIFKIINTNIHINVRVMVLWYRFDFFMTVLFFGGFFCIYLTGLTVYFYMYNSETCALGNSFI